MMARKCRAFYVKINFFELSKILNSNIDFRNEIKILYQMHLLVFKKKIKNNFNKIF